MTCKTGIWEHQPQFPLVFHLVYGGGALPGGHLPPQQDLPAVRGPQWAGADSRSRHSSQEL